MPRKDKQVFYPNEVRTIIGEGAHFNGIISFEGSMRVDGHIEGEVISNGTLIAGNKSVIKADIKIDSIIIEGKIYGDIIATCRLVMLSSANVYGNIKTPILQIEEGAKYRGTCDMIQDGQDSKSISHSKRNIIKKDVSRVNNPLLKEAV